MRRTEIFHTYAYEATQILCIKSSRTPRASGINAPVLGVRNPIYRFPVEVTLDHVIATLGTTEIEVAKQERILVRRGGTVIQPQTVNDHDYFALKVSAGLV